MSSCLTSIPVKMYGTPRTFARCAVWACFCGAHPNPSAIDGGLVGKRGSKGATCGGREAAARSILDGGGEIGER